MAQNPKLAPAPLITVQPLLGALLNSTRNIVRTGLMSSERSSSNLDSPNQIRIKCDLAED